MCLVMQEKNKRGNDKPSTSQYGHGWSRSTQIVNDFQILASKIEKHKKGDKKPGRKKSNRGWRRLITIVNDYKILVQ